MKPWHFTGWTLTALGTWPALSHAILYNAQLDTTNFGSVIQSDVPAANGPSGANSCTPAATANALAYLQIQFPGAYGTSLVGPDAYSDVKATATTLASAAFMDTLSSGGTTANKWLSGEVGFLENRAPDATAYGGMGSFGINTAAYPWFVNADPTFDFLYAALQSHAGIELGMFPTSAGSGHVITLVGLSWNDANNDGMIGLSEGATMTYVDPQDGQVHTKDIWQLSAGGTIQTDYYRTGDSGVLVLATSQVANPVWTGATNTQWTTLGTDVNWAGGAWTNSANREAPNSAVFNLATAAAISINSNIDVAAITFSTGGWVLDAGSGVLACGAGGAINITTAAGTDTINAVIADGSTFGTGGGVTSLTKSGAGTLVLGGANSYTGATTINAGVLLANNTSGSATGTGSAANITMNGGTLGGSGMIAGTVLPGSGPYRIHPSETLPATSAITLTLGGLSTSSMTTLDFNLVTPGASSVNDVIAVTGSLTINGGAVAFTNHSSGAGSLGYHKILQYNRSIQGAGISSLTTPPVVNGVSYVLYDNHDAGFVDVHRGLLGDANDDGQVNFADFVLLSNNFGASNGGWGSGDFNNDGTTNFSDFVILSNNFGETIDSNEMASEATSGVPEPTSLLILAAGLVGAFCRR